MPPASLCDGQLARISFSAWSDGGKKYVSTMDKGRGSIRPCTGMQFARQGKVNTLVAGRCDPQSGQPESKQTAVRIMPWQPEWQGAVCPCATGTAAFGTLVAQSITPDGGE